MYQQRVRKLQKILSEERLDAFFVTNPTNIFYLTGFKGASEVEREVTVLVDFRNLTLFAPKLYQQEAKDLASKNNVKATIVDERHYLFSEPAKKIPKGSSVGFESDNLRFSEYKALKSKAGANVVEAGNLIERLRIIKDGNEVQFARKAVKITDKAFEQIRKEIKVGMTERQVAKRIVEIMENLGSVGSAFEPIVASGQSSALPHYRTQDKKISDGVLLIDAGAKYGGYNGDLTRTFYIGKPDKKFIARYDLVLRAQEAAIEATFPGSKEEYVWKKTVAVFGKEAQYFTHGTGHGIGLDVHENPYLRKGKRSLLKAGMLITIEPGLYYPGWGGIRIEDYLIVNEEKCEILSKMTKKLKDMIIK